DVRLRRVNYQRAVDRGAANRDGDVGRRRVPQVQRGRVDRTGERQHNAVGARANALGPVGPRQDAEARPGDVQGEALGGHRVDAVAGGDGDREGAVNRRGAAEDAGGRVEGHAEGQGACLGEGRGGESRGRHREGAGRALREGGVVGAGNGRRLVDGEGEGLVGG